MTRQGQAPVCPDYPKCALALVLGRTGDGREERVIDVHGIAAKPANDCVHLPGRLQGT